MHYKRMWDRRGEVTIKEVFVFRPKYCVDTKLMHCFEKLWRHRTFSGIVGINEDVWYKNGGRLIKDSPMIRNSETDQIAELLLSGFKHMSILVPNVIMYALVKSMYEFIDGKNKERS